jgi:hypothetical protein
MECCNFFVVQRKYLSVNVDFDFLAGFVESFFKDRGFSVSRFASADSMEFCISRGASKTLVEVTVKPESGGVVVDFYVNKSLVGLSPLLGFFGGGYIVLKNLRALEFLEKIEGEFWSELNKRLL